jgi:hypothetical protein
MEHRPIVRELLFGRPSLLLGAALLAYNNNTNNNNYYYYNYYYYYTMFQYICIFKGIYA